MKPIKLEMTAFGSYAGLMLDFRKLDHCLYLITGDTGAGKTTIFDGIMFALYGVASGEGDKKFRTFEMMHCDYVDKSQDTVIRLEFEHMGKPYTVERRLHFKKKRDSGEYEKTTPQAKFWEPDKDVLEKTDAVTDRITELLGMNAEQFRKIVMLAQGEFKKFLDADSEEKNQILGELFDNSAYVWYQEMFDRARKKLARRRWEEGTAKIGSVMENFLLPENVTAEESEVYTPGHSGLEEALGRLVEEDRALQETLDGEIGKCRESENALRENLGRATEQNKKLEELAGKKEAFVKLQGRKPAMILLKGQAEQVEKALHKVKPKQVLLEKANNLYLTTGQTIQKLDGELRILSGKKTELENLLSICKQENKPEIERLGNDIAEIEKALPQYAELEQKSRSRQKESIAAEQAHKGREKAEAGKKQTEEKISQLKEQISKLEGIEGSAERRRTDLEKATEDLEKLTARGGNEEQAAGRPAVQGGIKEQAAEIRRQEGALKEKQAKYQKLLAEVGRLESIYHATYQAFIKGQAGLLARSLEQELQEKEEASCPVCRTVFQSTVPHRFAEYIEGTPEQGDVDKARAVFERKDKERQRDYNEVGKCETAIKGLKENTLSRLRELEPDCPGWETVCDTTYLDDIIKTYEVKQAEAKAAYGQAVAQCEQRKNLQADCTKKEKELETYRESIETYRTAEQEHRLQSSKLETEINTLKNNLKYPNKNTAEAQKKEFEKEKGEREKKIEAAEQAYLGVEKNYNSVFGALESNQRNLSSYKQEKEEAEKTLLTEVQDQGFQSMEGVQVLLKQAGETDSAVERWLRSKTAELQDYQNEWNNTRDRIKVLMEETKDTEKVDLEQLSDSILQLENKNKELQGRLELCKKQYENHRSTAEAVRDANRVLKETENAWKRLDSLADLAIGVNSAGGKISFDRYVMGDVFREVLDMANQRLDIISGGRYELIHEMSAARNNAKAGLEISVLDMTTGKCRSSSSLSGGESFFVSLALALGLSDVVQNHAGGKRLDALFIDEGFGTLDNDVLDQALAVLNQLTEGNRLVGIISHVEKLKESIPQQVKIKRGERGSFLEKIVN